MGKINIELPNGLHHDLKVIAAQTGNTLKSVIILTLEKMVREIEEKERKEGPGAP